MKRGLIVKGRRYYSPKFNEYVIAIKHNNHFVRFLRENGDLVLLHPKNVSYLSVDDFNLCDELAISAKMTWFFPGFDEVTGTEVNFEEGDECNVSSYRDAICDLSEGLIDQDFKRMAKPYEYCIRFRAIVCGMGFKDPGDYLSMFSQ